MCINSKLALVIILVLEVETGQVTMARSIDASSCAPAKGAFTDLPGTGNPYAIIVNRNVFRLIPPPPPIAEKEPPPPVRLTGFLKTSGHPARALFVSIAQKPKDTVYYDLCEGECAGILQVIKIREAQNSAEIIYEGKQMTIVLTDVAKPAAPQQRLQIPGPRR